MDPLQTQTLSARTSADIRGHSADTAILPLQASKSCPEQTAVVVVVVVVEVIVIVVVIVVVVVLVVLVVVVVVVVV